jgi:hypothetical protein
MKVVRVFKNNMSRQLCRDKEKIIKNGVEYLEYKPYKDGKVQNVHDVGYFYNSERKAIKKEHKAKNCMALSNGNYEKCLYSLKNGDLKVWRLNPNDKKSFSKKLQQKHPNNWVDKSVKHYRKYDDNKGGVL